MKKLAGVLAFIMDCILLYTAVHFQNYWVLWLCCITGNYAGGSK